MVDIGKIGKIYDTFFFVYLFFTTEVTNKHTARLMESNHRSQ